jgi:GAF domain-containing protein/HAMP domain-containing protein
MEKIMIQTNASLSLDKTELTLQAHKALQTIKLMLGAQIVYDLVLLYLAFQTGAWQLYACAAVMVLFAGASLVGAVFVRRGRIGLGVGALIGGLYIAILGTTFLVVGVGLVAGGIGAVLTLGIAAQTLWQREGSRAIIAGVVAGIGAVVIDRYLSLPYRLEFPALQTAILIIGGVLFLIYLSLTIRQFPNYSLRTKLIFAFIGVSILSVGTIALVTNFTTRNALTSEIVQLEREEALMLVEDQQNIILVSALGILVLVAAAAVGMAHLLAGPITRLTGVAQQITTGDLTAQAQVESGDEVGLLARTFNIMTNQMRQTIDTLEEQVSDRTQQLEAMVKVSQRLTGILDLSDLLRQVVNLTKETFGYYHVHIYLLDDNREILLMAEGYGEAGAEMKVRGHNISIAAPRSLVAQAAREGRVISVLDVQADPNWLPNPLLPEARSEMAVPISLGSRVVGVLDVQSESANGLGQEDEATLQALANQVAVAVRNARLFTETQEALYEAQRLQQLYTGQSWEKLLTSRSTDYEFRQPAMPPLKEVSTPEAVAALKQKQTVELRLPNLAQAANGHAAELPETQAPTALATPLKLRDQIIGVLGIHSDDLNRQWTADEIALIEAVSEQMSLAIENARLFEESQRNAWRDQVISESTAKVWSSAEIEEVMRAAVAQLGEKLRASEVVIRLGTEEELANF